MATVGIDVPLEFRLDDAFEHGICRFAIYSGGDDGPGRFTINRIGGGRLSLEIQLGDQELARRTVRLESRPPAELLGIELTLPGHDVLFEEALAAALQ
jgi:hypothetical protein